jgi:hypothetical protein
VKGNVKPSVWNEPVPADSRVFEVLDFTLFTYGLVRGDTLLAGGPGRPVYEGLEVWELDGVFRLGLPYFEAGGLLTRLSGLVTASKVEFSVDPDRRPDLVSHGPITAVLQSAFRGRR